MCSFFQYDLLNIYHVSGTAPEIGNIKMNGAARDGFENAENNNGKNKKPLGLNDRMSQTMFSFSITGRDCLTSVPYSLCLAEYSWVNSLKRKTAKKLINPSLSELQGQSLRTGSLSRSVFANSLPHF